VARNDVCPSDGIGKDVKHPRRQDCMPLFSTLFLSCPSESQTDRAYSFIINCDTSIWRSEVPRREHSNWKRDTESGIQMMRNYGNRFRCTDNHLSPTYACWTESDVTGQPWARSTNVRLSELALTLQWRLLIRN